MPEERVFGPILGAGVQLTEEVGQESVEKGRLGSTIMVGPFERGTESDITINSGRRAFDRKMGALLNPAEFATPSFASLYTPLMARHFFERAGGAGTLICLRVVPTKNDASQDDRVDKSTMLVWNREAEPKLLGQIDAHNGGAWAGKRKLYLGKLSGTPATDFPASNQIQLDSISAKTFKYDEYRDGDVILDGIPGISYKVVNISPTGLITLESDQDVESDWGSGETYGSETSDAETFDLGTVSSAWTIGVTTETGGPDTGTVTAAAASVGNDGAPAFNARAEWIDFDVNGSVYRVTFAGTEAAIDDYIDAIEAAIPGIDAQDVGGNIQVFTDQKGTGASVTIDGAQSTNMISDVFSTATPTETAGTGDVVNHFAATAAEIEAVLDAAITAGASAAVTTVNANGTLSVRTSVIGSTGNVTMSGNLITLLGFDGAQHDGTDGPSDLDVTLVRTNTNTRGKTKALDIEFMDGALKAGSEFGIVARIDGKVVLKYENLTMLSGASNNWVDVCNNDPNNDVFVITDTFTGDRAQATARPMNRYGTSTALTATRLTIADPHITGLTVGGDWVAAITWNSWGTSAKVQRLTVTMSDASNFVISTDKGNRTWAGSIGGGAVDMGDYVGSITVSTTSGTPQAGDYFYVYLRPLATDEAVGGLVFPNKTDAAYSNQSFKIIANGVNYVDVSELNDLTDGGNNVATDEYAIRYPEQCEEGYDGYLAGMTTSDYEQLLEVGTTPLRKLQGRGYGLCKVAAPGVGFYSAALALQQKLKTLVAAYNWCTKVEIPYSFHDFDVYFEEDLVGWINDTLLRGTTGDYASTHFPCFGHIRDPFADAESESRTVVVPLMGYILGNEAAVAKQYDGYHKAPAGISVQIPEVVELPVVGRPENPTPLNEEVLNPAGINVVKWRQGGQVVIQWGDRTLAETAAFKFYHKRCMLSHYENDLREGFDFTIFEINDPEEDARVIMSLHDYFLPEWRKRAIRGDTFVGGNNPSAIFKMDSDNNTDATRAQGDQIVEISLRLADTIERLRIFMGAMGVVEGTV